MAPVISFRYMTRSVLQTIVQPILKATKPNYAGMFLTNMRFALATGLLSLAVLFLLSFSSADDKEVRISSEILFLNKSKIIFITSCGNFDLHLIKAFTSLTSCI